MSTSLLHVKPHPPSPLVSRHNQQHQSKHQSSNPTTRDSLAISGVASILPLVVDSLGCLVAVGSGGVHESKGHSKVCRCKSLCRHWLCVGLVILRFCDHEMLKLEDLVFRESSAHRGEIQRVEILQSNVFCY